MSRNAGVLSVSSATVNCMDASMEFRCEWKALIWSQGKTVTVSPMYLFQKGIGGWYVDSALSFALYQQVGHCH